MYRCHQHQVRLSFCRLDVVRVPYKHFTIISRRHLVQFSIVLKIIRSYTLYNRNFPHDVPEFFFSFTLKHWKNTHSVNYFSYIAVRTLTAFLNSVFTICFTARSVFLHFKHMFTHFSTIKERCEHSYSIIGKIINAVSILPVLKS